MLDPTFRQVAREVSLTLCTVLHITLQQQAHTSTHAMPWPLMLPFTRQPFHAMASQAANQSINLHLGNAPQRRLPVASGRTPPPVAALPPRLLQPPLQAPAAQQDSMHVSLGLVRNKRTVNHACIAHSRACVLGSIWTSSRSYLRFSPIQFDVLPCPRHCKLGGYEDVPGIAMPHFDHIPCLADVLHVLQDGQ